MALVFNDRVKETSVTTGTGTLTLDGAVQGFETFSSAIGNSNTTYYAIELPGTTEFEVGRGTVSAGQLARTEIISSSNSDSAVDFSAGTKIVFCTLPASKAVIKDASNNVTLPADLTVDTNTLHVDSSNNRVGINDSTPSQALDVSGRARSTRFVSSTGGAAADAAFYLNDTNGLGIFSPAANEFAISTSASEKLRIDSSGNLGIGTSSPSTLLHLSSSDPQITITDTDGTGSQVIKAVTDDLTVDVVGQINLDADNNGLVTISDGGTQIGSFFKTASTFSIKSDVQDKRLEIKGNDGGSEVTAVAFHMANAGQANFNDKIVLNANKVIEFGDSGETISGDGTSLTIASSHNTVIDSANQIILDAGNGLNIYFRDDDVLIGQVLKSGNNDFKLKGLQSGKLFVLEGLDSGGSLVTALSLDMSAAGAATFNDKVILGANKTIEFGDSGETISGNGTDLTIASSGFINLNASSDITLNAAGNDIRLYSSATEFLRLTHSSGDAIINSLVSDKDIKFQGNDGGSGITALTLDMSEAGMAKFNSSIAIGSSAISNHGTGDLTGVSKLVFGSNNANDPARIFKSSNVLKIQEGTSGFAIIDASSVNSFVIDANQNVSIPNGNLTLGANLDVSSGTIKLDGDYPTGSNNVALGDTALDSVTSGGQNTAIGSIALTALTTASFNTAIGYKALEDNISGTKNTAIGSNAASNTTGANNVAIGVRTLFFNTSGGKNTAVGEEALLNGTSASQNTALGYQAGASVSGGSNLTILGYQAEPSSGSATNEITLGNSSVTSLRIPGLQSGASSGDVLTFDGTDIGFATPTGVSAGFAVAMAIAL